MLPLQELSNIFLDIILESSKYFSNLDINAISKSVIKGIDTGKRYNSIKAIRGRNYIEILYLIFNYPHKHYTFKHFEV